MYIYPGFVLYRASKQAFALIDSRDVQLRFVSTQFTETDPIICYRACGLLWLIIGLLMTGLGIVPLAVIGVAIRGYWPTFWNLVLALALAFGPRIVALTVMYRLSKRQEEDEETAAEAFSFDE